MNDVDNFTQQAVALFYDSKSAPRVTAKGSGSLAEEIIALALQHDVPLQENPELVALLSLLELGEEIPHELYVTIAHIIAFAYVLKGKPAPQSQTIS